MWRNHQAIGRAVKGIFTTYCWLEADESMIRFRGWLRPDLHICQGIVVVNRQFLNRQCATVGYLDGDMMREWVGIIRYTCLPIEVTYLKNLWSFSDKYSFNLLPLSNICQKTQ